MPRAPNGPSGWGASVGVEGISAAAGGDERPMAQLYDRHPCWDRVGRKLLEEQWRRRQDKEMRFRSYTAEEHYRLLIQRRSPLIERVPLRHLASYMRITPETLSRIRARLRGNGENDPIS